MYIDKQFISKIFFFGMGAGNSVNWSVVRHLENEF